ncbi:MAG TPA: glycosyltransferase family 1 protein [Verrucomicrobiae bacterium]|nr:glycosyltransferase family 1 protein [Verrucomicrobiae bacterium]
MNIGISTSVIQRGRTGIAQYVFNLVREFRPHAGEHGFVLFTLEEDVPLFDFAREAMRIIPVSEEYRPAAKNIWWHQTVLPRLCKQYALDVIHIPSYRRMLWPRPCKLVATIHDLAPFHVANKYDWKRMFYGRVVARRLAHRQHEIIVISRNTGTDVQKYFGIPARKLNLVYNGLNHDVFWSADSPSAQSDDRGRGQTGAPKAFLYVARLEHPGKNHVGLIEAFNRFKASSHSDWQLVLAGSKWSGAEHIERAVRESPYAKDIRCTGFVPDAELPALYRSASVFVYPSLYEGFGLPPLEAMACGVPVICSTGGALREMAGKAAALVEPGDTAELAAQMTRVAGDPLLRAAMREKGLAHAEQFQWRKTADGTLRVYAKALGVKFKSPAREGAPEDSRCHNAQVG